MRFKTSMYIWYLLLALLFSSQPLIAQICVDDYFFVNFRTTSVQNPVTSIAATDNEIITAGNAQRYNSLLEGGWLTRYSAQGSILWSKIYYTGTFNFLNFRNISPSDDGNYFVTGNIGDVDTTFWPLLHITEYAVIMKVDKYGNLIWSKILSDLIRPFAFSDITSIDQTAGGDVILSLNYFTTSGYRVIVRMDTDGNVKWTTLISSPLRTTSYGDVDLKVLANGNVVTVNYLSTTDDDHPYQRQGYYLSCLNPNSGEQIWSHFILSSDTLSFTDKVFTDPIRITELPNHDLSFITSYAIKPVPSYFRKTDHVLNFVTDNSGILKKVTAYTSNVTPLYASSVAEMSNGRRVMLLDDGDAPFMTSIGADGGILWQKGYASVGRSQETKSVLHTDGGLYYFSYTHNGGSRDPKLIKTDSVGNAPCIETPFSLTATDFSSSFFMQAFNMTYDKGISKWNDLPAPGVYDYAIQGTDVCRIACCTDITDTAEPVNLCNVDSFKLANNDIIRNSGTYAITYKTSKGCDSIVYYHINLSFTPSVTLGADTCFGNKDSVVLKTAPGYTQYVWNGMNTNSPVYVVKNPGTYNVRVTNTCGIGSDTVQVLKSCEFEIFMPNAFTPNGDGLNDWFRVPKENYNRLINFTIFNRWGQKVFETKDIGKGWNGNNGEYQAPTGTYVYIIIMESLDRRKTFAKKGYVTLIR